MNIVVVWLQASLLAVTSAVLAQTSLRPLPLALAGGAGIWWLVLNHLYARSLGGQPRTNGIGPATPRLAPPADRADADARVPNRIKEDHHAAAQAVVVVGTPALAAVTGAVAGVRILDGSDAWLAFLILAAAFCFVMYASSIIDWYYVRPRLDGVVWEPPCRTSRLQRWGLVTRLWFWHRAVAEILGISVVVWGISALGIALSGVSLEAGDVVAVAGGVLAIVLLLAQRAVKTLRDFAADEPRLWLGDLLRSTGRPNSYLLHVTARSIVLRDRDESGAWRSQRDFKLDLLDETDYTAEPFRGCDNGCLKINDDCEWPYRIEMPASKRRWLIL